MFQKLLFIAIVGFFATMNVLLWRIEFGGNGRLGSPVPVEAVVRRILTAPDDSSLEIRKNGGRIGYCHWIAGAAEELVLETPPELEGLPEGMVQRPTAYAVHMEGGILTGPVEERVRFSLELQLNSEREWKDLVLRLGNRPTGWEVKASSTTRTVKVRYGPEDTGWTRQFSFEELMDPGQLAMELGGPLAAGWLSGLSQVPGVGKMSMTLSWDARMDWMMVGGTRVQVYRLQAKLADRHEVLILVSRVGEIMRVELPGGFSLVNEVLASI